MFTGIVQTQAVVVDATNQGGVLRLALQVEQQYAENLNIGASIAINGCCLTVVKFASDTQGCCVINFDVIDETLKLTNLGKLAVNDTVNFERSVTFGTELGGHIVSGHIHCMAEILSIKHHQDNCKMQLALAKEWQKYVLYKGFVSVNGASLTVGEVDEQGFWLHLIPETLSITNLDNYREGDKLNIEVDQQTYTIINTVENYLSQEGHIKRAN
ncbi:MULTISPECIES: riboflavin synthase subunit alpha [unclassified Pseudoalteromonas]|jgi:riboflavin synthase|uniref:riboflavin synthase subunit alpha n=1 Tax=unclassified Pseudoalteromonas TaxID=194690 RepID=UPI00110A3F40|nr:MULTISPECIES: riboflavin synthase subunit alpha [unclassified Pseudoalteromonas]MCF2914716.1 riboflavin synthase subunit alpha [Pseudoalteromonas sp. Cn5-37]NHH89317.1 Riboflavin synthase [Pseudoalteromonas sp. MB47]TMP47990.1 riboflavin synthase [Pseudoalteromonas sp. S1650]TMP65112.1 riboflavin synthase [Pseudoalteromonas sp. S1649]